MNSPLTESLQLCNSTERVQQLNRFHFLTNERKSNVSRSFLCVHQSIKMLHSFSMSTIILLYLDIILFSSFFGWRWTSNVSSTVICIEKSHVLKIPPKNFSWMSPIDQKVLLLMTWQFQLFCIIICFNFFCQTCFFKSWKYSKLSKCKQIFSVSSLLHFMIFKGL